MLGAGELFTSTEDSGMSATIPKTGSPGNLEFRHKPTNPKIK